MMSSPCSPRNHGHGSGIGIDIMDRSGVFLVFNSHGGVGWYSETWGISRPRTPLPRIMGTAIAI